MMHYRPLLASCTLLLQDWPLLGGLLGADDKLVGVDGNALGAVVSLVDADEVVSELKHVVAQTNDHELGVPARKEQACWCRPTSVCLAHVTTKRLM
jgi:hypothetical protein